MPDVSSHSAEERSFAATLLRQGARVAASQAAETLLDRFPEAGELFGRRAFRGWHDNLTQRVGELAAAVQMGSAELFVRDVAWSVAAFAAREVPTGAVAQSLDALRDALRETLPADQIPAVDPILAEGIAAAKAAPAPMHRLDRSSPRGELALGFLELVLEGRRQDATRMLVEAFEAGIPLGDLYEKVLLPVESEIGTMWHLGEVSVPEEHTATESIRGAMAVLSHKAFVRSTPEPRPGVVLVSACEGDRHDIGVRAVADIIEVAGFTTVYLGADVPTRDLVRACESYDIASVVLSAAMTVHLPALAEAIKAVRGAREVRVLVGGGAFRANPALATEVGADGYAATAAEAVRLLG